MKLFLCGGGSGEKILKITKLFGDSINLTKPLLYIPLAMEKSRYDDCFKWITAEMEPINLCSIEMVRSIEELASKKLDDYCALYIGGGNTYKLLKEFKETNCFEKIQDYIDHDGVVFGGSAGAIIFGKDIDSCKMQDNNIVGLKDTKGFDVLNGVSILCHLNRNDGIKFNRDKNSEYLLKFSKKEKTIYLPDEDVILVDDKSKKVLGNMEYRIYENGEYITCQVLE